MWGARKPRSPSTIGGQVSYTTEFGSLESYRKGFIELIDDDAKHYAFSNMFEVASASKPYEKVAVGKNMQYVLEVLRAEGTSEWRTASHDEFALVMDGVVTVDLVKLDNPIRPDGEPGSVAVGGEPAGKKMGRISAGRGHMGQGAHLSRRGIAFLVGRVDVRHIAFRRNRSGGRRVRVGRRQ